MIHELDIVEEVRFTTFQHHTEKNFGAFSYVEMWKITALLTLKKRQVAK